MSAAHGDAALGERTGRTASLVGIKRPDRAVDDPTRSPRRRPKVGDDETCAMVEFVKRDDFRRANVAPVEFERDISPCAK